MRARGGRFAPSAAAKCARTPWTKSPHAFWRCRKGGGFTCCTRWISQRWFHRARLRLRQPRGEAQRKRRGSLRRRRSVWRWPDCSAADSSGSIKRAACTNSRRRKRCWTLIFRSRCMSSSTGWPSGRTCARVSSIRSRSAIAKDTAKPSSNSCLRKRAGRRNGCCSTSGSSARLAARCIRNRSRAYFRSTILMARARGARDLETQSISTSTW